MTGGGTPWSGMLRAAAALGVEPEAFWRLSLREWRMLTERPPARTPMRRLEFERLAEAWPDG
jgi:uncharacterized phage protein (TIGR02216 family)